MSDYDKEKKESIEFDEDGKVKIDLKDLRRIARGLDDIFTGADMQIMIYPKGGTNAPP